MEIGGDYHRSGFYVNDLLTLIGSLVGFQLKIRIGICFSVSHLGHKCLLYMKFIHVVSGALMELTPLFDVLLCLPVTLVLQLQGFSLGGLGRALSFSLWLGGAFVLLWVRSPKSRLFYLNF